MEQTRISEWRWLPTAMNPADDATRWSDKTLQPSDRWFMGPDLLRQPESSWPQPKPMGKVEIANIENLETQRVAVCVTNPAYPDIPLTARLFGWEGLSILARCIQLGIDRWRKRRTPNIIVNTKFNAENYWHRVIQTECFTDEMAPLREGKSVFQGRKIVSLNAFVDSEDLLQAKGLLLPTRRLSREMPLQARNPSDTPARAAATLVPRPAARRLPTTRKSSSTGEST